MAGVRELKLAVSIELPELWTVQDGEVTILRSKAGEVHFSEEVPRDNPDAAYAVLLRARDFLQNHAKIRPVGG